MTILDAEELFHLGLDAAKNGDAHKAIENLKVCLSIDASNAQAAYLLGALYAQIGMYERAKDALRNAVELDPTQISAQFQLGLLHLTSGEVDRAKQIWQGLEQLESEHYLRLFALGMEALIDDRFDECVDLLGRGIQANSSNPVLNADMQKVIESAKILIHPAAVIKEGENIGDDDGVNHVFLANYQKLTDQKR